LGTVARLVRGNGHTRCVAITDNVIPHEKRFGDTPFTTYFLKACDGFITMSEKVMTDLRKFEPFKNAVVVQHPLYDAFGDKIDKEAAREHLGLQEAEKLILFFGFIRKYKGLDLLLEAMADDRIRAAGIRLLVAGDFYEDKELYSQKITDLGIEDRLVLRTDFIADSEVKYYLCAADAIIQPYKNATQSGVTPLAYHFEKPMVVTNVGGLAALVPHERAGLVCEPNPTSIADAILRFYELGEAYFIPHLRTEKLKYSWSNLTAAILDLAKTSV
jgi:glycosyltransferase involved in cell wall biosynthesis